MTKFEKSLRALDKEALRAGAEELLSLLAQAGGVRYGRGGPGDSGRRKRRSMAAPASAAGFGSTETEIGPAIDGPVPGEEVRETVRARRPVNSETDGGIPVVEETVRGTAALPVQVFPEGTDREDQEDRKLQEDTQADTDRREPEKPEGREKLRVREDQTDRAERKEQKEREALESREDREDRENREDQEDREDRVWTLRAEGEEAFDSAEMQTLERRLQSVSEHRRGSLRQPGGDEDSGVYTAAFRGPERHYEGAVGARGMEMRRISDYFRRDSRRYDTGFTRY